MSLNNIIFNFVDVKLNVTSMLKVIDIALIDKINS